jgi:hypothetical protein
VKKRIYSESPGEDWPTTEFTPRTVTLVSGQGEEMPPAERDTLLGKKKIRVREIRKLSQSGHQTAIISTDFNRDFTHCAAAMFARWCQENFFRYMREHYNLNRCSLRDVVQQFQSKSRKIGKSPLLSDRTKLIYRCGLDFIAFYYENFLPCAGI